MNLICLIKGHDFGLEHQYCGVYTGYVRLYSCNRKGCYRRDFDSSNPRCDLDVGEYLPCDCGRCIAVREKG